MTHSELTHHYDLPDGARTSYCTAELDVDYRLTEPGVTGQVTVTQWRCRTCGQILRSNDSRGYVIAIWPTTAETPVTPASESVRSNDPSSA